MMKKRLLSLFLAITMLLSFVPDISATGNALEYIFDGAFTGLKTSGATVISSFIGTTASSGNQWKMLGCTCTYASDFNALGDTFRFKSGANISFEITVPSEGEFAVAVNAAGANGATNTLGVSIKDSDDVEYVSASDAVETVSAAADYQYGTVNLTAGKYTATFTVGAASKWICVYNMVLSPVGGETEPYLERADVSVINNKAVVSGRMSNGEPADLSNAVITFESSDENVAAIDSDGNITKKEAGQTTITATVTIGEVTLYPATVYTVAQEAPGDNLKIVYDFTDHFFNASGTAVFTTNANYKATDNFWEYVGNSKNKTSTDNNLFRSGVGAFRIGSKTLNDYNAVRVKIRVPFDGTYKIYSNMGWATNIPEQHVYLYGANDTVDNVYTPTGFELTAGMDISELTAGEMKDISFGEKYLSAGEYYVVILSRNALETGKNVWLAVNNLILTTGTGTDIFLMDAKLSLKDGKAEISGIMSDGKPADFSDATVVYESSDGNIAGIDEKGNITDKGIGDVIITATISLNGVTVKTAAAYGAGNLTARYNFAIGTEFGSMENVALDEVTYAYTNGFYRYLEHSGKVYNYGTHLQIASGGHLSFEMKIPVSGEYNFRVEYPTTKDGVSAKVYISEADAFQSGNYGKELGGYSSYNSESSTVNSVYDGIVTLAGKVMLDKEKTYVVTFKNTSSSGGGVVSLGALNLLGESMPVLMGVNLVLEPGLVTAKGVLSDGTLADMTDATVLYSVSDENAVSIDREGRITEKRTARVTISASVTIGKITASVSKAYQAIGAQASISAYYDIAGALTANGMTFRTGKDLSLISFDETDGLCRFFSGSYAKETTDQIHYRVQNITIRHGVNIAFKVFIPQAGVYEMEMWNAATNAGADVHVYVSKDTASKNIKDKIGTYRCYDKNIEYNARRFNDVVTTPNKIKNIRFSEPGYYIFNFVSDASWMQGVNTSWSYCYGSVGSFSLSCGDKSVLMAVFEGNPETATEYIVAEVEDTFIRYTDPEVPGTMLLDIVRRKLDGTDVSREYDKVSFESLNQKNVTVDAGGLLTAVGDGEAEVKFSVTSNGKTYENRITVTAYDDTGVSSSVLSVPKKLYVRDSADAKLLVTMNSGNVSTVQGGTVKYFCEPEGFINIDKDGVMTCVKGGEDAVKVTASISFRGADILESAFVLPVLHSGKSAPTYYTEKKRENARENISKYSWAKSTKNTAVALADKYLESYEKLYGLVPREGIPRARQVSHRSDSAYYKYCRYCGKDVESRTSGGYGGWNYDPVNRPWKIQCPECKRLFPSNDFGLLYERGLDENGMYNVDIAKANNAVAVENGEKDALRNELYPEIGSQKTPENGGDPNVKVTLNNGRGLRPGETVEGWGVDDGWGYRPKDEKGNNYTIANGDVEIHCYIANYHWQFWYVYEQAINAFADAYIYTGDIKYGRAGAILLDRYADVLPEYNLINQVNKDGTRLKNVAGGYIRFAIGDTEAFAGLPLRADALYPALEDDAVISYLSQKATEQNFENDKSTKEKIWQNWKNGLLLELFDGVRIGRLTGNPGMPQRLVAACAVVLDEEPETTEMLKWLYAPGVTGTANVTGGNVLNQLVDEVSRDGFGNESGDNYNSYVFTRFYQMNEMLENYETEVDYNIWNYPKFPNMFAAFRKKILVNNQLAQIGDSSSTANIGLSGDLNVYMGAFKQLKDTEFAEDIAQYIYAKNNYSISDLHYDIFTENPESIRSELAELISKNPEQNSELLAGYGFAVLRDGGFYSSSSASNEVNNLRDAWIYFGAAKSHAHNDNLNIGLEAFGLNIAPDNGYPERAQADANRAQWTNPTVAHNTVVVNEKNSIKAPEQNGVPLHFDSTEQVKLIDVDADYSYEDTENYRRTLVMVKVNDDISYTLDFFRVTGGNKHTYSFHSQAENALPEEGLQMVEQKDEAGNWVGTYAYGPDENGNIVEGVNVPYKDKAGTWKIFKPTTGEEYGEDPWTTGIVNEELYFPVGYTWMHKVRRDKTPEEKFAVEFDVRDYRKTLTDGRGIRLRLTQLNNFTADEVAIVAGLTARKNASAALPETFDYLLVQREKEEGKTLDSLFTTVFEPYRNERYIDNIELCEISGVDKEDATVRALKITHTGEKRIDYIIYSENTSKTYRIDNLFDFRGFVGVYSVDENGNELYRYVNDGDIIAGTTGKCGGYTGTIAGFDDNLDFGDFENYIDINLQDAEITEELLRDITGRWIFIENDGAENAAYEIFDAEKLSETTIRLDTGNYTNVRGYVNPENVAEGYVYNMGVGDRFRIPLSFENDASPVFEKTDETTTSAGSTISIRVKAVSPINKEMSYEAASLPRGASFNEATGVFTWKPDNSQIGENHVAITARDTDGRESTVHFTVTVYGSTTDNSSANDNNETDEIRNGETTDSSGTAAGGGGGGGGSTAPLDKPDDETNTDENDNADSSNDADDGDDSIRFTDLDNHIWAADAIYELAVKGIIKGTSQTTFSPGASITRADFALLLVRAFKLTSGNTENFADVAAEDYYAPELAIARNTGIVNGIGNNLYAPRNSITRQDMMVIAYRALQKLKVEFGIYDEPQHKDFSNVADYAKDAVSALIGAGVVNGKSGLVASTDYTTRAEVAVLIKRILDFTEEEK